ncbi:cytochrome P450 302a1, mitochondrial-like [Brevipalpus obovatus]|uniref:cytochrome P450 302a1, mitochondrial-like n=1 Tax=Brevipalpus obovatus TaxID=246614 RepID=UPI003D9EC40B
MRLHLTLLKEASVRPFNEIPGPRPLPLVGNVWRYLPIIGDYDMERARENGLKNLSNYGSIVRETLYGSNSLVHLFDPNDMETLFRNEGKFPARRSHRALMKYRRDRPHLYPSGGLFPENGEEWYRLRKMIQGIMMKPKVVNQFIPDCDLIAQSFIHYIRQKRNEISEVDNIIEDLHYWALENILKIFLGIRFGALDCSGRSRIEIDHFIDCVHQTHEAIMKTEIGSLDLWKYWSTKSYSQLVKSQDSIASMVSDLLEKRQNSFSEDSSVQRKDIFSFLMPQISSKDILGLTMDMILAGIDTTALIVGYVLYHLAKNPPYQRQVRKEVDEILSASHQMTSETIDSMKTLKACVKEGMRLNPLSIGTGRFTTSDIIIRNYHIPKGTMIITQNQVACLQESNFSEPYSYLPERWLSYTAENPHSNHLTIRPFAYLPFGYGTRMCVGRRISEIEIYTLVARIVQNFFVEYHYGDLRIKSRLINIPDKPLKLRFIDINGQS